MVPPPKGYQCVYESYFEYETKLWFPIPRLVTAYMKRRGVALSQFLNGAWRLAVALMVIGAEAGGTLNVRAFEELVSVKMEQGLVSLKIRPNYNVVTGYPSKTNNWQRSYFYVKSDKTAFEEPLATSYRNLWTDEMGLEHPSIFHCFSCSNHFTSPHFCSWSFEYRGIRRSVFGECSVDRVAEA